MAITPKIRLRVFYGKIQWVDVLDIAHVTPDSNGLPCNCICPSCKNNLTILRDTTTTASQWFYCRYCELSGDMVELLAAYLKVNINEAINVLISKGLIDDSDPSFDKKVIEYINKNVSYRNKLLSFWRNIKGCEERFTKEHIDILTVMGFDLAGGYRESLGQVFGFCNKKDIVSSIKVLDTVNLNRDSGYNRVFCGPGWNSVCVVPSFDMPGRIKTITIFGNVQGGEVSCINRHIAYRRWGLSDYECGLMFLEDAIKDNSDHNVVVTDTIDGLRMAVSHAEIYKSLPSITVLPDENARVSASWNNLVNLGKTVVITGSRSAAMSTTGDKIRFTKFDQEWDAPWMTVNKWINSTVANSHERIVETSLKIKENNACVKYASNIYESRKEGIYANKIGCSEKELMSDTILQVEEIIVEGKTTYYKGKVIRKDKAITFKEKEKVIDSDIYQWLNDICNRNELGVPVFLNKFKEPAKSVYLMLHEPKYASSVKSIGDSDILFKFANYDILNNGNVVKLDKPRLIKGTQFCVDDELDMFDKSVLSDSSSDLAWAVAVCVFSNVISKRFNKNKVGIGVDKGVFKSVQKIAELLGCHVVSKGASISLMQKTLSKEVKKKFPTIITPEALILKSDKVALEHGMEERNCIVCASKNELYGYRLMSRWVRINDCIFNMSDALDKALRKLSVNFLSWLVRSNFRSNEISILNKTIDALKKWCNSVGIENEGIDKALSLIDQDIEHSDEKSKAESFKKFLGNITIFGNFTSNGNEAITSEVTWIACKDFYKVGKMLGIALPDRSQLSDILIKYGIVIDYSVFRPSGNPSWAVRNEDLKNWEKNI